MSNPACLSLVSSDARVEINHLIADLQSRNPKWSYSDCRSEARRLRGDLFGVDTVPVVNNRTTPFPSAAESAADESKADAIGRAIYDFQNQNPGVSYGKAREAVRQKNPQLFTR